MRWTGTFTGLEARAKRHCLGGTLVVVFFAFFPFILPFFSPAMAVLSVPFCLFAQPDFFPA
ncbi:hypothetical protein BEN48_04775 [Hymenobacter glacialis]|uniref:Uncharacterized protein n=1 Tax=Hymenobacter glacialis TaxID=1908236 RepID=A0A1G1SUH6_9BACT|nr:hypothetical protein BEN48_04775 [Hymenobacter glacialis]